MSFPFAAHRPPFALPAAGSAMLWLGNSKGDRAGGLGQMVYQVAKAMGWTPINHNMVSNASFGVDGVAASTAGWTATNTTLAANTAATFGIAAPPGGTTASFVGRMTAASAAASWISPFNPAASSFGGDTVGDTGGLRCGMNTYGGAYAWSANLYLPTGVTASNVYLSINTSAGEVDAFAANTLNAWQTVTATLAQPSAAFPALGITQGWVRVVNLNAVNGQVIYVDNAMLENWTASTRATTGYVDYYHRDAISGCMMSAQDHAFLPFPSPWNTVLTDGASTFAARCTAFNPAIVFVEMNLNDLYYTLGNGASSGGAISLANWTTAATAVLGGIRAALPNAAIVALGVSTSTFPFYGGATAVTVSAGGSGYGSVPTVTAPGGGTGTFTAVLTGGAVTSVTINTAGVSHYAGQALSFASGAAAATISATNAVPPAFATSFDDAARQMDDISRRLCSTYGALFVPIHTRMGAAYASTIANDGKHPARPAGMAYIASLVVDALRGGG